MTKKEIFQEAIRLHEIIQTCAVNYNNTIPYYNIICKLEELYKFLDFKGCNEDFDRHKKELCLDRIKQDIDMCKAKMPEKIAENEEERKWYMEYTLGQLKHTSAQCIVGLKQAYEWHSPLENHYCESDGYTY